MDKLLLPRDADIFLALYNNFYKKPPKNTEEKDVVEKLINDLSEYLRKFAKPMVFIETDHEFNAIDLMRYNALIDVICLGNKCDFYKWNNLWTFRSPIDICPCCDSKNISPGEFLYHYYSDRYLSCHNCGHIIDNATVEEIERDKQLKQLREADEDKIAKEKRYKQYLALKAEFEGADNEKV